MSEAANMPPRARPGYNRDNMFFRDGLKEGKFLIQRCVGCQTLRQPPRAMCPKCHSFEWDVVEASGMGTIYSYATHHHPPLPGIEMPARIVLVELDEGVRAVGNLVDATDADMKIGNRVTFTVRRYPNGDDTDYPQWKPEQAA